MSLCLSLSLVGEEVGASLGPVGFHPPLPVVCVYVGRRGGLKGPVSVPSLRVQPYTVPDPGWEVLCEVHRAGAMKALRPRGVLSGSSILLGPGRQAGPGASKGLPVGPVLGKQVPYQCAHLLRDGVGNQPRCL